MAFAGRGARLGPDRRGTTAVEFALVGSAFFILLLLLMEVCWQVAVGAALDAGGREASRWAATGQSPPPGLTATGHVTNVILTSTGLPLDAGALEVTVESVPGFGQLAVPGAAKPGLGGPGDIVRYTVVYRGRGLTPLGRALLPLGLLQIHFVILAKNEPYPAG
ncbi:TadE/TadG family type IV pilus assembly protein [Roseicella aerolata]|uniref:Pilus assembly protein n=1 Tax=Roseicella aerolata TaxID=2883479 RepID=A0A9X1L6H5_9PROT|nr:TadE/TadG family type IV pilus assembly protein [Roseicella aerolata]MCB4820811.1 pilus assembly protein [Roseicella aerolata]